MGATTTKEHMLIRPFRSFDTDQIARLFHDTIRHVNRNDYTEAQVKAWAPEDIYFRDWEKHCGAKHTYVAEKNNLITGFAQLEDDGHIDCFYCHREYLGQGIGSLLLQKLEDVAIDLKINRLYAEVSITAKPFFLKKGFILIKEQEVRCRGELLTNYVMERHLGEVQD